VCWDTPTDRADVNTLALAWWKNYVRTPFAADYEPQVAGIGVEGSPFAAGGVDVLEPDGIGVEGRPFVPMPPIMRWMIRRIVLTTPSRSRGCAGRAKAVGAAAARTTIIENADTRFFTD
jgi:hypothetical protein